MSIYHETEDAEKLLFKKQRHLRAKLQFMEDTPTWFERRLEEDTGINEDDLETIEATGTPGDCGLLPDSKLEALEVFLRRYDAGAITANAGEAVIAVESPYASEQEKPRPVPVIEKKKAPQTIEPTIKPMNASTLLKRYDKIEKPHGFQGRFCKQFGFSTSTLFAILKGKAGAKAMARFEEAVTAAEAGQVKMNGAQMTQPKAKPREERPAPKAPPVVNGKDTVQIPRSLLPFVIGAMKTQRETLDAQIAELQELS